jgi:hypothetical protein
MPSRARTSDEDLFLLCDEIQELDGRVTTARLREAAGGGGHNRLKAVVEAWQVRRDQAAKQAGDGVQEKKGRGRDVEAPAPAGASRRRGKTAAGKVTLEDVEQAQIAMEAGRVKVALSGREVTPTETPGEPDILSSLEQAEADVAKVLNAAAKQKGKDEPTSETETATRTKSSTESSEATAETPASAAPISSASAPSAVGANTEIIRLQAHVEDLRRENGMLWDQVKQEREARIREIELLNGMIQAMRR